MNATTFAELRQAAAGSPSDQKMDQVRELLFGEYRRISDARLAHMEGRLVDLEREVRGRLGAIEARIEALATASERDRRRQFEELGRAINELGAHIGTISRR